MGYIIVRSASIVASGDRTCDENRFIRMRRILRTVVPHNWHIRVTARLSLNETIVRRTLTIENIHIHPRID